MYRVTRSLLTKPDVAFGGCSSMVFRFQIQSFDNALFIISACQCIVLPSRFLGGSDRVYFDIVI